VKIKLKGQVKVVQDGNNEVIIRDDVFQLNELVYPYQVALSTEIEENLDFHVVKNTFVDVDVLITNRHIKLDENDDSDLINIEVVIEMMMIK
jgi:hypothetical protein